MARASNDVSRIVCANIIRENKKRLLEARIKNQVLLHKVILPILKSLGIEEAYLMPLDIYSVYVIVDKYCVRILYTLISVISHVSTRLLGKEPS